MGKYQREKGKRGERELASLLRTYGYACRRGQQYSGLSGNADVAGLPGIYIECKRVEKLNIQVAIEQAISNSYDSKELPAVFHRKDGKEWLVTIKFSDWINLYRKWERMQ